MVWRLFVLPMETAVTSKGTVRRPKYFDAAPELAGVVKASSDYGQHNACIVAADVTNQQRNFLTSQPDVALVPANLDTTVGGALATTQNVLEAMQIPAGWVATGTTWRVVVRTVLGLFQFAARYEAITNGQDLLPPGVNLDMTMADVPQARRDAIQATADSYSPPYDTSAITGGTTIRAALKILADQWTDAPFFLGGLTL